MVTALYRRYRPETFAEMIGQSQVTDPLMTALRTNRVNHAYLFSGPRGCGKTTSARILARCLNCAEGPTDTPCGVCPSCVELGRDGPGSLDVVEIDAASHNGVDDARDLRERAVFAPARDRFKIFILDEAHMVTPQGFNALLKIVEEPPEHIKFIFATTEPDKVIGTIRSRTHHYPFRLIPPAQLLEYVQSLCDSEGVEVAPGVLPLVVRAGGGSARDTLSLLDQLIAGSESNRVEYERAVALLGYTHGALLSEAIDALGAHDGAAAFDAVDRVIQTGQDPRRFVEDLLERLRDIIVVAATREQASSVLRGVPADEIEVMRRQAALFGHAELSRVADIVNSALSEMTGATSPRLHLELMVARALVPAADDTQRGALARVERLERRIGVDDGRPSAPMNSSASATAPAPAAQQPEHRPQEAAASAPAAQPAHRPGAVAASASSYSTSRVTPPAASSPEPVTPPTTTTPSDEAPAASTADGSAVESASASSRAASTDSAAAAAAAVASGLEASGAATPDVVAVPTSVAPDAAASAGEVSLQQLKDAWPEILEAVQKAKMTAWLVVFTAQVRALDGDVLTLAFPSENDVASFKERSAPGQGVSEYLRQAILDVLGLRVKYIARVDTTLRPAEEHPAPASTATPAAAPPVTSPTSGQSDGAAPSATPKRDDEPVGWATPGVSGRPAPEPAPTTEPAPTAPEPAPTATESAPTATELRPAGSEAARTTPAAPTTSARSATSPAGAAAGGSGGRGSASATSGRSAADRSSPAATTSWDVVSIPTSTDEEPPPFDEPMPSDEPDLPADRAESPSAPARQVPGGASTSSPTGRPAQGAPADQAPAGTPAPATRSGNDPAARPGALRFEGSAEGQDSASADSRSGPGTRPGSGAGSGTRAGSDAAPGSRPGSRAGSDSKGSAVPASSTGGRARYGEAVVREILQANFIEEQPLPGREN
ncbi:DNA polymerase III subunit gamma and tau [Herbiconiux sp. P15]|uniref:DNA polymerase III subunit gamma and tau n=1 Tax=Herbiconiux liukaitaii TaxID=3342799 RepID=UPI0035BA6D74